MSEYREDMGKTSYFFQLIVFSTYALLNHLNLAHCRTFASGEFFSLPTIYNILVWSWVINFDQCKEFILSSEKMHRVWEICFPCHIPQRILKYNLL